MGDDMVQGRFSIRCWITPRSAEPPDAEAYFDDMPELEHSALRLLRGGKYKLIAAYEWDPDTRKQTELGTYTLDNIGRLSCMGRKAGP
jgi:hypothetical protein